MYHVGIDWADQKHDVAIVDQDGDIIVKRLTIKKNHDGFEQLVNKLRHLSDDPQDFKIGIETSHNLLVDYLVDLGYRVYTMFTGAMKSFRKRYRASGARDDEFDCYVIADVLRTDKACWRQIDFGSELVREIRLLAKDHHALVQDQVALTNSLRSTLKEYYPEYIQFFDDVTCANSLAFIQTYPDFESASKLTHEQLNSFFKQHKLRNGKIIKKIYDLLHQPALKVPPVLIYVKRRKASSCAKKLASLNTDLAQYVESIKERLEQHPDGAIFLSYPGVSHINAARLLALFGDNRKLYTHVSELQALAGTAPVTEQSGKNLRITYFRLACNKFFRDTMHALAFCSLRNTSWAMAYYKHHRAMGKTNSHVLRCLANIHLKILYSMWKKRTLYDENIFLAQRARHLISSQKEKTPLFA